MQKRHSRLNRAVRLERGARKRRVLASEKLESRELLTADLGFFAGSNFLDSTTHESTTTLVRQASTNQFAETTQSIPTIQFDLPTQYDPVARKIGQSLFDVYTTATQGLSLSLIHI